MALNLSAPAELKSVFFTDPLKSNRLTPKFSGSFSSHFHILYYIDAIDDATVVCTIMFLL
jgi:hypothetical protein